MRHDDRLKRIEKNYLRDKAMMTRMDQFGHVEADSEKTIENTAEIKKNTSDFMNMVKSYLRFMNGV
jgi:hypothetical protein